jgi:hypothetical protein
MTAWMTLPQGPVVAGQSGHINDSNLVKTDLMTLWGAANQAVVNVCAPPYNAVGDGVADDTLPIQNALNAAAAGSIVQLPPGTVSVSSPLTVPPQVQLQGSHSSHIDSTSASVIKPTAGFTGAAVILLVDQSTGGYAIPSTQQSIRMLTIDGSNLSGSTIDGIQSQGFVHGVVIEDVQIRSMPNHAIAMVSNGSGFGYSWRGTRILANNCQGYSYSIGGMTDCTWIDLESIGSGKSGFLLNAQPSNTVFTNCRSEYSNQNGFEFTGAWTGSNTGGGGCQLIGCSTDGSNRNGILITATGDTPLSIIGGYYRRDGANVIAGGGGYAGIQCTGSTIPVSITQPTVLTGLANSGAGQTTPGPQYGVAITSTSSNLSVNGGVIYGNTTAWFDDGSNSAISRGANLLERVGGQTGYTSASHGLQSSLTGVTWDSGPSSTVISLLQNNLTPEEIGYILGTVPTDALQSTQTLVSGTVYLARVVARQSKTISNLTLCQTTIGSSLTVGLAGIYSAAGTLLQKTADQSTNWSTGSPPLTRTMALASSQAVVAGQYYYLAVVSVFTGTAPVFMRTGGTSATGSFMNLGAAAGSPRWATLAGQSTLPSSITLSSTSLAASCMGVFAT